jgi:PadR family transcriptional regulator, regulatory protein PadR
MTPPTEVPYGTLDLLVLKTLRTLGPLHGFGVARRIEQMARGVLSLNQGTIYPALLRLEQQGLIASSWGTSDNNRRAKFYEITRAGEKHLAAETKQWARMTSLVNRLLEEGS